MKKSKSNIRYACHIITIACLFITLFILCPISANAAQGRIGWITFDSPLAERPDPFAWLTGTDSNSTLRGMIGKFDDLASRNDITALAIHLKDLQVNRSQLESICWAIERVRESGKPVHVFATNYGPSELILAACADEIIIQPGGIVSFPGLYTEEIFLADTLKLVGIQADMLQVGDYKGASEQMARNCPSPEWSENIDKLLDDIWAQMCEKLKKGRNFSQSQLDEVLNNVWLAPAEQALKYNLIDKAIDILDIQDYLTDKYNGASITTKLGPDDSEFSIDFNNPFAMLALLGREPDNTPKRATIAVIHIDGTIIDGKSTEQSMFGGRSVGDRTIRKALKEIEDEDLIKGLVVRINSPGGSAIASEIIWQGLKRVAEKKPVYISVGTMAASGGYYIAVGGDKIFVDNTSIVGSIGVVSGKMVMGELYNKLNVGVTARARGPMAHINSSLEPFGDSEREKLNFWMVDVYNLFADHVKNARGNKVDMSKIAEGRLFTGRQAIKNGMADGLADFDGTINLLADDLNLRNGKYDVMTYPSPMSFEEMMQEMLGGFIKAPQVQTNALAEKIGIAALAGTFKALVGENNWPQIRDTMNGLMQLQNERILLISPRVIVIK